MKTTDYINCKIIKYQRGDNIQRKDAIKDYKPQIQESIKQQYTPTYSEISQDNRSKWEKSQSREKADKAYKDYIQAKNTEEAMRTLDGLATMSDYIGLGAGVGSIIGRGLKYAGKRIARNAVKTATSNKFSNSTLKAFSSYDKLADDKLEKLLPDYAKPNWQGDDLVLTKERLTNGGFERLSPNNVGGSYDSRFRKEYILSREPSVLDSKEMGKGMPGDAIYEIDYAINKDMEKDFTPKQWSNIKAHEYNHYVFRPKTKPPIEPNVSSPLKEYLINDNGAEQSSRGTQLKNYFGLNKGNQDITPEMWEYARRHYIDDTQIDNGIDEMLEGINSEKLKSYLKWLNDNSATIAAPIIGKELYGKNK